MLIRQVDSRTVVISLPISVMDASQVACDGVGGAEGVCKGALTTVWMQCVLISHIVMIMVTLLQVYYEY